MRVGFVPDHGHNARYASVFVRGTVKARKGLLAKLWQGFGVESSESDDIWALSGYRCDLCGRVELYAVDRPIAGTTGA